jgi:hypothetical protein
MAHCLGILVKFAGGVIAKAIEIEPLLLKLRKLGAYDQ